MPTTKEPRDRRTPAQLRAALKNQYEEIVSLQADRTRLSDRVERLESSAAGGKPQTTGSLVHKDQAVGQAQAASAAWDWRAAPTMVAGEMVTVALTANGLLKLHLGQELPDHRVAVLGSWGLTVQAAKDLHGMVGETLKAYEAVRGTIGNHPQFIASDIREKTEGFLRAYPVTHNPVV